MAVAKAKRRTREEAQHQFEPKEPELSAEDMDRLEGDFGGRWCDCIKSVIKQVTPEKLAVYCEQHRYRQFHKATEDDTGVRYGYYLTKRTEIVTVHEEEISREVNIVAGFGKFFHRPYETLEWTLKGIQKIAEFERRSAQAVAEDVAKCDPKGAPEPLKTATDDRSPPPLPQARRMRQASTGMRRI